MLLGVSIGPTSSEDVCRALCPSRELLLLDGVEEEVFDEGGVEEKVFDEGGVLLEIGMRLVTVVNASSAFLLELLSSLIEITVTTF